MPYRKLAAGQVPGSVPRILPFVRQRDDVAVEHMETTRRYVLCASFLRRVGALRALSTTSRRQRNRTVLSKAFRREPGDGPAAHLR